MKASAITAKEMVERARQIHKTLPVATAALGRSLMAASMMGNQLKEKDGSVTLRIKGGGPLGGITVVSDSQGNARGYVVNPLVDLPPEGPRQAGCGQRRGRDGSLTVIKDLCMKEPYVGTVNLLGGEIAEDIAAYLRGVRADPHRLRPGSSGGPGPERPGRRRLSDPAAARRRRGCHRQGGGQPDGRRAGDGTFAE